MRRLSIVSILTAALAAAEPLAAQDAFGTWQGTLATSGRPLRDVFDITRDNGRVKVVFFSIDQSGFQSPVTPDTIELASREIRLVFSRARATFTGTLDPRGDTITGTWTQGAGPRPLVLVRANAKTEWRDSSSHSIRQLAVDPASHSRSSTGVEPDGRSSCSRAQAIPHMSSISLRRSSSAGTTCMASRDAALGAPARPCPAIWPTVSPTTCSRSRFAASREARAHRSLDRR